MFTFSGIKSKFAVAAVVAAGAIALPAAAQAAVPPLPSGYTQAYLSSDGINPTAGTITLSGHLELRSQSTPLVVTCDSHFTVDATAGGITTVTAASFTNCDTSGIPGCSLAGDAVANLPWDDRLAQDPNGQFVDLIDVDSLTNKFATSGSCPFGDQDFTGVLEAKLDSPLTTASFDASSGVLSNPALGNANVVGDLTVTAGSYFLIV